MVRNVQRKDSDRRFVYWLSPLGGLVSYIYHKIGWLNISRYTITHGKLINHFNAFF